MMVNLPTWSGRSHFKYNGSIKSGITIFYGSNCQWTIRVTSTQFKELLSQLSGKIIPCGAIREVEKRSNGSLGEWLAENVTRTAIASYVAPILINEGYCKREADNISFHPYGSLDELYEGLFETQDSLFKFQAFLENSRNAIDFYFENNKSKIVKGWQSFQWPLGMSREVSLERLNELERAINKDLKLNNGGISKQLFVDIEIWGFGHTNIDDVSNTEIEDATRESFRYLQLGKLKEAAENLGKIKGVGISRASKILAISNQNIYGIYDSRTALALSDIQISGKPILPIPPGQQRPSIFRGDYNAGFERFQWILRYMLPKFKKEFGECVSWRVADVEIGIWVVGRAIKIKG
jgi:hypothetical protein